MALTEQQIAQMRAAWDKGVRDKAQLRAAAGIATFENFATQPEILKTTTPQAVSDKPDLSWGSDEWYDQGAALGSVARGFSKIPVIPTLLGYAGGALETAGFGTRLMIDAAIPDAIQKSIGWDDQTFETYRAAAKKAKDEGNTFFDSIEAGMEAANKAHGVAEINLPGEGIDLPDWLAGREASIDKIDWYKLATELPGEIIGGKGFGKATTGMRHSVARNVPGVAPFIVSKKTSMRKMPKDKITKKRAEHRYLPDGTRVKSGKDYLRSLDEYSNKERARLKLEGFDTHAIELYLARKLSDAELLNRAEDAAPRSEFEPTELLPTQRTGVRTAPALSYGDPVTDVRDVGYRPDPTVVRSQLPTEGIQVQPSILGTPQTGPMAVRAARDVEGTPTPITITDDMGMTRLIDDAVGRNGEAGKARALEFVRSPAFKARVKLRPITRGPRAETAEQYLRRVGLIKEEAVIPVNETGAVNRQLLGEVYVDYKPSDSPFYDVSLGKIPESLLEIEEMRLRGITRTGDVTTFPLLRYKAGTKLNDPLVMNQSGEALDIASVMDQLDLPAGTKNLLQVAEAGTIAELRKEVLRLSKQYAAAGKKAASDVMPTFMNDLGVFSKQYEKIDGLIKKRNAAIKRYADKEKALKDEQNRLANEKAEVEVSLNKIIQERDELLNSLQATMVTGVGGKFGVRERIIDVADDWDSLVKEWLEGKRGKPSTARIIAAGSARNKEVIRKLKESAKEQLDLENRRVFLTNARSKIDELDKPTPAGRVPKGPKSLASEKAEALTARKTATKQLGKYWDLIDEILTRQYTPVAGGLRGMDLLINSGLSASKQKVLLSALRNKYDTRLGTPQEVSPRNYQDVLTSDQALEFIKQEAKDLADKVNQIDEVRRAHVREIVSLTQRVNRTLIWLVDRQAIYTDEAGNWTMPRAKNGIPDANTPHEKPPLSENVGSPNPPKAPVPEGAGNGGKDLPPGTLDDADDASGLGKRKYVRQDKISLLEQMLAFLASANRTRLAQWVQTTLADSSAGGTARTIARAIEFSTGAVNRWIANNSRATALTFAYSSKMQNRLTMAQRDVIDFVEQYIGEGNNQLSDVYEYFPMHVNRESARFGKWGVTDEFAGDVVEVRWFARWITDETAEHAAKFRSKQIESFVRQFSKFKGIKRMFYNENGRLLPDADILRNSDNWFDGKAAGAVTGGKHAEFVDELGRFFDEMHLIEKPDAKVGSFAKVRRLYPRQVEEFGSGVKASEPSMRFYKRFHDMMADGAEAGVSGVKYKHNLLNTLIYYHAYVAKEALDREFRSVALDPIHGFIIPLSGLVREFTKFLNPENIRAYRLLNEDTKLFVDDINKEFKLLEAKWAGYISDAEKVIPGKPLTLKLKEWRPDKESRSVHTISGDNAEILKTKIEYFKNKDTQRLNAYILKQIGGTKEGTIKMPSDMFWANNLEGEMKLASLHRIYNIKDPLDVSKSPLPESQASKLLRGIGLQTEDIGLVSTQTLRNLEESLRGVDHLIDSRYSTSALKHGFQQKKIPLPEMVSRYTGDVNLQRVVDFWRLASTGADFAYSFTLGFLLLFNSPRLWTRMTIANTKAFFSPDVLANMIKRDPELAADIRELVQMRIGVGDQEVYQFFVSRGQRGMVDTDNYMSRLIQQAGSENSKDILGGLTRKTFGRFQRSYNTGTILTRVYWKRALKDSWTDLKTGEVDWMGLKSEIERLTGGINTTELGLTVNRRVFENFFVGLSPRLTRSAASLVVDAQRGLRAMIAAGVRGDGNDLKFALTQGRKGKSPMQKLKEKVAREGREATPEEMLRARELTKQYRAIGNLSTMLAAVSATMYGANYWYATQFRGLSHQEAEQIAFDSINPLSGKKYMSIEIEGTYYGVGGFYRSLFSLNAKIVMAAHDAIMKGDHSKLAEFVEADQNNNPLIAVMRNRGAPAVNALGTVLERTTGHDFMPYDVIDNTHQMTGHIGKSFLPFALQGIVEGEGTGSLFGMMGLRTSLQSRSDAAIHIARQQLGLNISQTSDLESWLRSAVLYPLVKEQYDLSARASNDGYGRFSIRRDAINAKFLEDIQNKWSAGGTDYEMISFYFEQKRIKQARIDETEGFFGMDDHEFRVNKDNPINVAVDEWFAIWDDPDVQAALVDEKWDLIEEKRDALLTKFTPEQQAAVMRTNTSGIHREIFDLLKPESQKRYIDTYKRRLAYIRQNVMKEKFAEDLIMMLQDNMFPSIGVPRGATPLSSSTRSRRSPQFRQPISL